MAAGTDRCCDPVTPNNNIRQSRFTGVFFQRRRLTISSRRALPALAAMVASILLSAVACGAARAADTARPTGNTTALASPPADLQIVDRLAGAQAELKRLEGAGGKAAGAPPDAAPEELEARRGLLKALITWCQWQLERADMLADLKAHGTGLGILPQSASGLPQSPPYSFLLLDELRQRQQLVEVALKTAQAGRAIAVQEAERAHGELRRWQGKDRQLAEQQETSRNPEQIPRIKWERELVRLDEQVAAARLGTVDLVRQYSEEEIKLLRPRLALIARDIARMAPQTIFSKRDFELVQRNLEAERRANQAEMAAAVAASAQALKNLEEARTAEQHAGNGAPIQPDQLKHLERVVQIQRARADNSGYRVNEISLAAQTLDLKREIWRRRWSMVSAHSHDETKRAFSAIGQIRATTAALRAHTELQLELSNEQRDALQSSAIGVPETETNDVRELASVSDERGATGRLALRAIDAVDRLLNRWTQEIAENRQYQPLMGRLGALAAVLRDAAQKAWNFELIAVEDTIEVEGQTLTGKRSITVSKVATAILIFVLGSWLSGWALKKLQNVAVRRLGKDKNQAQLVRKWVYSSIVLLLAGIALLWVKIPFTVFAFLGGAIAIGAGFGMQTLLKNLISGLMLLVERPFKLGDLVEVGGMRGRVMDIGVRSSVVRSVDGIETLIPNSVFLEQNVTNWTYSSQKVRFSLPVNVAYGSNVRKVRDTLIEAALRHPGILDQPPPSVLLSDFGNDALVFNLNFWLEMRPDVDSYIVRSDLRFTIEQALNDLGIVIAFPQRDVHLDSARPLQVEVVSPAPDSPNRRKVT